MKKSFLIALFVAASLSAGVASADSTHECQGGHNCNDGGSVGPITISTPVTIGPVTATATGIGMGGAGGAGGQGGSGGIATSSSSATGGTASATGGSATSSSSSGGNTLSTGSSASNASNGGNTVRGGDVNVSTNVRPAASAPSGSLTSVGTDNCLGSVNGSFGNGFISIGGGKTIESPECNRRANARQLDERGHTRAAMALRCMNDEVRLAMKIAGDLCPQDEIANEKSASVQLSRDEKIAAARALKNSGLPNVGIEVVREEVAPVGSY